MGWGGDVAISSRGLSYVGMRIGVRKSLIEDVELCGRKAKQILNWIFFVWWREEDMRFGASRLVRDSRGRVGFGPLVRAVCCFFSVSKSNSPKQREYWCVVGCLWLMSPTCSLEMRLWLQRSLLYLVVNKFLIPFFSE